MEAAPAAAADTAGEVPPAQPAPTADSNTEEPSTHVHDEAEPSMEDDPGHRVVLPADVTTVNGAIEVRITARSGERRAPHISHAAPCATTHQCAGN